MCSSGACVTISGILFPRLKAASTLDKRFSGVWRRPIEGRRTSAHEDLPPLLTSLLRSISLSWEQLLAELAEHELRYQSAFGQGASAAASHATEITDRFAERTTELMREFQRRGLHLNRSDPDLFSKVLNLQSWFLEGLDRRLVQAREKMAAVYDTTLHARASQQAAYHASIDAADDTFKPSSGHEEGQAARAYERPDVPGGLGADDDSDEFD